jgi:membrane protein required for colicin V production
MELSALDVVFIVIVLITTVRGIFRGFVAEIMSMASLLGGIIVAAIFSGIAAVYLEKVIGPSSWSQVIAFLGIFLVTYVIMKIFEGALQRLVEKIHLESLDRALGFFLGIIEGLLLVFLIILVMQLQPFFEADEVLEQSRIAQFLLPLFPLAAEALNLNFGEKDV